MNTLSTGTRVALLDPPFPDSRRGQAHGAQTAPGHHTCVKRRLPPERISMKHKAS